MNIYELADYRNRLAYWANTGKYPAARTALAKAAPVIKAGAKRGYSPLGIILGDLMFPKSVNAVDDESLIKAYQARRRR